MSDQVEVYTRPRCLFCHQVLELLQRAMISFRQIDVTDRAEQDRLTDRFQAASFPLVVVNGVYVGGYAHVLHLHAQSRLDRLNTGGVLPASALSEPSSGVNTPIEPPRPQPARSHFGSMSRLHQSLKEEDTKKR